MKNRAFRKFVASIGVAAMVVSTATNAMSPAVIRAESAQELEGQQNDSQEQGGQEDPVAQSSDDTNGAPFADAEPMAVSSEGSQDSQEAAGPSESSDSNGENGTEGSSGENTNASAGSTSTEASGAESQGAAGTMSGATNGTVGITNSTITGTTNDTAGAINGATDTFANGTSTDASTGTTTGENGEASGDNAEASTKEITSVITEDIDLGTYFAGEAPAYAQLELPDEIEVKVDEEKQTVTVTWNGEETYHPDQAGTYIFSSELDKEWNKDENGNARYQLAEKVELPKASVRVEKKAESTEDIKAEVKSDNKTENKTDAKLDIKEDNKVDAKADNKSEGKTEEKSDNKSEVTTKPETTKETTKDTSKENTKETSKKDSASKDKTKDETEDETKGEAKNEAKEENKTDTKDETAKADQKKKVTNTASLKAVYVAEDGTILCGTVGLTGDSFTISDKAKSFNGYELKTVTLGEEELPQDTAFTRNTSTTETKEEIRTEASYTYTMDGAEHEIAAGDTATITFTYAQKEEVTPEIASIEVTGEAVDTTGAAIQGDYAFPLAVGTNDLSKTAPYIQGYEYQYAEIGTDKITSIAKEVLEAGKYAYYVDGELLKENTKITYVYQEDEDYTEQLTGTCGNLMVTVSAKKDAKIPEGTIVRVSPIESARMPQIMAKISETLGQDPDNVIGVLYDISLDKDGEEIQPKESVHVTMKFDGGIPWNVPEGKQIADTKVVHMHGGETDVVAEAAEDGNAEFETESFSTYVLMAAYEGEGTQDNSISFTPEQILVNKNPNDPWSGWELLNNYPTLNPSWGLRVKLRYSIPKGALPENGEVIYQLNLSEIGIKQILPSNGQISWEASDESAGTYEITEDGLIKLKFNENAINENKNAALEGTVSYEFLAGEVRKNEDGSLDLPWSDGGKHYLESDLQVKKESVKIEGTRKIKYTITVSSKYGTATDVTLQDIMENVVVDNIQNITCKIGDTTYKAEGSENGWKMTLPKMNAGDIYSISYEATAAEIPEGNNQVTVKNTVEGKSKGNDGKDIGNSSTTTDEYVVATVKKSGTYDSKTGLITWEITINNASHTDLNGWNFQDKLNENNLNLNDVVDNKLTLKDENGNESEIIALPYYFGEGSTQGTYTITYQTRAETMIGSGTKYKNVAILTPPNETNPSRGESEWVGPEDYNPLTKEGIGTSKEGSSVLAHWKVTINADKGKVDAPWTYTDTLDAKQHYSANQIRAIANIVAIQRYEGVVKGINNAGTKIEIESLSDSEEYKGYEITFSNSLEKGEKIEFTYFSTGKIDENNINTYENTGNINNKVRSGGKNTYTPDHPLLSKVPTTENRNDDGTYDYDKLLSNKIKWNSGDQEGESTGILSWKITYTPNGNKNQVDLIEQLPDGVTLRELCLDGFVLKCNGGKADQCDVNVQKENNNYKITIPASHVEGKTEIILNVKAEINDKASWTPDESDSFKSSATFTNGVSVTFGGKIYESNNSQVVVKDSKNSILEKKITSTKENGKYANNQLSYKIIVNKDGLTLSQNGSEYLTLTDVAEGVYYNCFESMDLLSITFERLDPDSKEWTKFNCEYTYEPESGNGKVHNVLKITIPDKTPVRICYTYEVFCDTPGQWIQSISNTANLRGIEDKVSLEGFRLADAGSVVSKKGVTLKKVNKKNTGDVLADVEFGLWKYENGTTYTLVKTTRTNANGIIEYPDIETNTAYYLEEISGPANVKIDKTPFYFYVKDNSNTQKNMPEGFEKQARVYLLGEEITRPNEVLETTSVELGGTKSFSGYPEGKTAPTFKYTLKETTEGVEKPHTDSTTTTGAGTYSFNSITYSQPGTYTYEVKEEDGKVSGVTYDSKIYRVTVTVTDDGSGKLTAAVSHDNSASGTDLNFTNHYDVVTVPVAKSWSDDSNRDNKRPSSITVNLFADGTKVTSQKITAANGWKYEFKDLPKYKDGKEIKYTITEDAVEGYTSTVDGFNITNTYTPEKVQVSGSKNWNDDGNAAGTRPGSITIRLYANGSEIDHKTVTEKDGWSWNWTGLNRYNTDHKEISYTISEDAVDGYTSSVSGYNVTNTVNKPQVGSVILTKVDATTGTALAGAVFDLYRANNTKVGTYTTNAGGVLRVDGLTFGDYYFVETKAPEGYALESQRAAFTINATTTVSAPASVRVTNKPVDEKIGVSAAKVWDDENNTDGVRPSSVTFRLFADGVEIGSAQASEANGWTVSFGNLPKTRNGVAISYAVKEDEVGNYYEASYETGLGSDGSYVFTVKNYRETDKHYEERTGSVRGANRNKPSNGGVAGAGRGRGTGDESDMTVYGTVSGASLLALIVWMIARRKRAGKGTK